MNYALFKLFPRPRESLPLIFIVEIIHHSVCLALKREGIVCLHEIMKPDEMKQQLYDIPQVEAYDKHLPLLQ